MKPTDEYTSTNIPIPEGLEQRLSDKIDEWERLEIAKTKRTVRLRTFIAVAASLVIVAGIGWHVYSSQPQAELGAQDTYSDPEVAYNEAQKAVELLAANLNKGMDMYYQSIEK